MRTWLVYQIKDDGTKVAIAVDRGRWENGQFKPGMSKSSVELALEHAHGTSGYYLKIGDIKKYLGTTYEEARTNANEHGIRLKPKSLRKVAR